jgi:hypothetical protein
MPEALEAAMNVLNLVFTIYFVVEFLIRITGQGPDIYSSGGMNWWVSTHSFLCDHCPCL